MLRAQNRGGLFLWLLAAFGEHFEPFLGYRKRKKPCKYTLQGFAIICFDILRYGRDSNPRPSAWQADILTNWTTRPFGCGRRIWTNDLRVMSPTSYRTAPSRDILLFFTALSWVLIYYITNECECQYLFCNFFILTENSWLLYPNRV